MIIADLRTLFKERSGDINMSNANIDRYINSGIELLDLLTDYSHAPALYYGQVNAGESVHKFSSKNRVVREVWIIDSEDGKSKLEKVTLSELKEKYPNIHTEGREKPTDYAIDIIRAYPETFDETSLPVAFQPFINTVAADYSNKGIIFMPPADKTYVVEVLGVFHSSALSDTYTQNWWSFNYPDVVLDATLYRWETVHQNTKGANDYFNSIKLNITGMAIDKAEEDSVEYTTMRG